jgi:hypothetical protein
MNAQKRKGLVALLQETLPQAPTDQAVIRWIKAQGDQPDETGQQRRTRLALRIAMIRAAIPVPPVAPVLQMIEPATPEPVEQLEAVEPVIEVAAPPPPRKKARMTMSTVRLEDAALLLGTGFGDSDDTASDPSPKQAAPDFE